MAHPRPPLPPARTSSWAWRAPAWRRRWRCAAARPGERIVAVRLGPPAGGAGGAGRAGAGGRRSPPRIGWNPSLGGIAAACHARQEPRGPAGCARRRTRARSAGLEVIGELELGWRLVPNEFIAVTGTNGKTTTVELIGAMHRAAGVPVAVAGNVGTPVSSLAGDRRPGGDDRVRGVELPARGLDRVRARGGGVAELLATITSTATARSPNYRDAKLRIFANQDAASGRRESCAADVDARRRRLVAHGATSSDGRSSDDRATRRGRACAARTTSRMRWPRPPCASSAASTRDAVRAALREFARRRAPLRDRRRDRRRRVRQRLQGHEPECGRGRAALVRRRRARDPRRLAEGRRLRGARAARSPSAAAPAT